MVQIYNPFGSSGEIFKAMQIIFATYSVKLKKEQHVTNIINAVLNKNFNSLTILKFIEQINIYPHLYGYDIISNKKSQNLLIQKMCQPTQAATCILTPSINFCKICTNKVKLEIKNKIFSKEPLLFGIRYIGIIHLP